MLESAIRPFFENPEAKRPTKHCIVTDCGKVTKGDKNYCLNHVEDNPYVKALLEKMAQPVYE